jgi:hypothetical protein
MTLYVVVGITFGEIDTILKQTLLSKFQVHSSPSAFQWIWKTKVTKKLKCFVWLVFKDRINSRNLLKRKHYKVDDDDYNYVLCSLAIEEFTYHLLFQCPFSTLYWTYLNIHWGHSHYFFDTIAKDKADCQHEFFIEVFAITAWEI